MAPGSPWLAASVARVNRPILGPGGPAGGGSVVSGEKGPATTTPAAPPLNVPPLTTPVTNPGTMTTAPGKDAAPATDAGKTAPAATPAKPPVKKGRGGQ